MLYVPGGSMTEAAWALAGALLGALISGGVGLILQARQFKHDERMYQIANLSKEAIKSILLEMLNHKNYTDRSFSALRERVGGITDDELRKILHELGARKTSRNDGAEEWWYLESRLAERIEKRETRQNHA